MKRTLMILALLAPAVAHAQIYPLEVYGKVTRDNGQAMKFLKSQNGRTYVGLCKGQGEAMVCDLAKPGTYTTDKGLTFKVVEQQLKSTDGKACHYDTGSATLDC